MIANRRLTVVDYLLLAGIPGLMFCVIPVPGMAFRFSWQLVSLFAIALCFSFWLRSWWLRLFFLVVTVQVAFHPLVITNYVDLLLVGGFMAAAQKFSTMNLDRVFTAMVVAIGLLAVWILLQKTGLTDPYLLSVLPGGIKTYTVGVFNPNYTGCFLAMCIPGIYGLIGDRMSGRLLVLLIPVLPAGLILVLTKTTTAAVAAFASGMIYLFLSGIVRKKDRLFVVLMVLAIFFVSVMALDPPWNRIFGGSTRVQTWKTTSAMVWNEPAGYGLGSFADIFPLTTMPDAKRVFLDAHNEYVQAAFEFGLQGFLLIVAFVVSVFYRAMTWSRQDYQPEEGAVVLSGLISVLVCAGGVSVFHVAPTALISCAWIGLYLGMEFSPCR